MPEPIEIYIPDRLARGNIIPLEVQLAHTLRAAELPLLHSDPFDRMIVAQAQSEGLQLLTADRKLGCYDCNIQFV